MLEKVYLLQHVYQYGTNHEYDEVKVLGIYSSREGAERAISSYKRLPGFRNFSDECFVIDMYELNKGEWREGFIDC